MLDVKLFGGTRIVTPAGPVEANDLGGVKPRQILEILAISPGNPVSKERLADLLWDGAPPRSWVGTLESYVCLLRRALRGTERRPRAVVTVTRGYLLDRDVVRVDLAEFRALRQVTSRDPLTAARQLESAVDLVTGELFPQESYASWAVHERSVVTGELLASATTAATLALRAGEPDLAARMARVAIQHDRIAEEAWRLLMEALWRSGRRSEAVRAYFDLREVLDAELGTDPDAASQALYLSLLRDGDHHGGRVPDVDRRSEVRMLLSLLRDTIATVPGLQVPREDRHMVELAASLAFTA